MSEVDLKDSLDKVDLGDDESSNENYEPVTAATTSKCSGKGTGVVDCSHGDGSHGDGSPGDGSCGDGSHGDGNKDHVAVSDTNILREQSLNSAIVSSKDQTSPTPRRQGRNPLSEDRPPLEYSDPPSSVVDSTLTDILTDSAVLNKDNYRRAVVNPFAKLQSHGQNNAVHFTSTPAAPTTAGRRGGNEQGHPLLTTRKGLSLKARKRKFVMSPSKPQQGKPVKQVSQVQTENDETTKCAPLLKSASYTPPLFSTPPPLTPSPFTPHEKDLLQQYKVHTTPCRR